MWFRRDLRLSDQPALQAAVRSRRPVVPVYIHAPAEDQSWAPGGASRWWLHHSLQALDRSLVKAGSRLILRAGPSVEVLRRLIRETGADAVYWNRLYEPSALARDEAVQQALVAEGVAVQTFNSSLLFDPGSLMNKAGHPFQVFTPFWKACLAREEPSDPLPAKRSLPPPGRWPASDRIADFCLLPERDWADGFGAVWTPGERGARDRVDEFCDGAMGAYREGRDRPGAPGTSRLSPHLHFGEISPRQIWHAVQRSMAENEQRGWVQGAECYLRELGWREFAHHLLVHFPRTPEEPLRAEFADFPWREDADGWRAWRTGRTGYPIVDAGLRELWHTGWMHNRVRMIVASFLVKDLLIPWQQGAAWFWDTLVDADLASNTLGWQWTAGCGADAAPYFRIFNPVLQGQKFDPAGEYVRRWNPELADLPDEWIHRPWEASPLVLREAGVTLGKTYPQPVVDHKAARHRALAALSEIKGA